MSLRMAMEKKRLGDILLGCNLISQEQLGQALAYQKNKGIKLGQALIEQGIVTEDDIIWALGNQLNISFIHLNPQIINREALKLVSAEYARDHKLIPLYQTGNQLNICMVDPLDFDAIETLAAKTQCSVNVSICTSFDFEQTFSAVYGPLEVQENKVTGDISEKQALERGIPKGMEGPEKVINYLLGQAIINRVDRVHFEPSEKGVIIRFRTNSILSKKLEIPFKMHQEVINKLKTLSQIPLSTGTPTKTVVGHFRVTISGRQVNVQSLFYPTVNGEMVILKLTDFGENAADVVQHSKEFLDRVAGFFKQNHGILYITGPRESGKTTSAYYLLNSYNLDNTKIVTVEDPVIANFPRMTQMQIGQPGIETFIDGFELASRLDPDVIYLDHFEGKALAEAVVFAGLGGKSVITSFPAYDAASSIVKLLEQAPDPVTAAMSLAGILSQRLIRQLCSKCKQPIEPSPELAERLKDSASTPTCARAVGCDACQNTGYSGRLLVYEFIPVNSILRQMMINRQNYQDFNQFARKDGIPSIEHQVLDLVIRGETSFDEFLRFF